MVTGPRLAAVAVAAALGCLVAGVLTTAAAGPALWERRLDGLYGDNVAALQFVGVSGTVSRSYLLLPTGQGLYRYGVNEAAWLPVYANPDRPSAVVRSVLAVPSDPNGGLVYAGLEGQTLFARSEDTGLTWHPLAGPSGPRRLDLLAVTHTGQVFAAERGGTTLFTSNDRGDTWAPKAGPALGAAILALFAAPDEGVVYVVAGERLYRLDPTPSSWTEVLGPGTSPAMAVALAAAGPRGRLYAVGATSTGSRVLASEDRGGTWPASGWPAGARAEARALTAGEQGVGLPVVWLGLADGQVLQSSTAAATWLPLGQLPLAVTVVAADAATGDVWAGSAGLGLFRVVPTPVHTGVTSVTVLALAAPTYEVDQRIFLNAQVLPARREGGVTVPALHGFFESTGGDVWVRRALTSVLGANLLASPGYAADRRLYSGRRVTVNEGATWLPLGAAPGGVVPSVAAVGPLTGTLPVVYALETPYVDGVGGSGLVRSEDGGDSWRATDVSIDQIVDVVVSPRYTVDLRAWFLTESGSIYRTSDGLSFSQVGQVPAAARQRIAYDLELSPDYVNDNTLFAAVEDPANLQQARVYVSTNAGAGLWQDRSSGLPVRGRPRRLVLSPNFRGDGVMFLGGERAVGEPELPTLWGSDAAGEAWYGEYVLPPSSVSDFLWLGALRGGRLFAAAGAAGLWRRALDGPPSALATPTAVPTGTATATATFTATSTSEPSTPTPIVTVTVGATPTASATPTDQPTRTATHTAPPSATAQATASPSPSPTALPPTGTPTPTDERDVLYLPHVRRARPSVR